MDNHSKEVRSYNMSRIRSSNTKPEEIVRKYLFREGFRYRKNVKTLPGKPDIVLKKYKTIIFINGCFWHFHENCRYAVMPSSNIEYWEEKLRRNKERDQINIEKLKKMNWNIITVWECELKKDVRQKRLLRLVEEIRKGTAET